MTADDVNKKLKETARAYPNRYEAHSMIPMAQAALDYAKAWQPRANKAGLQKTMEARIKRLQDILLNLKKNPQGTMIVNGSTDTGKSWTYVFQGITGPYIESAGIVGDEDIKSRAWDGLITDLKNIPREIVKGAGKLAEEVGKGVWSFPWWAKAGIAGVAGLGGYALYARIRHGA
jgi:hypothetical protein